jgi:hypothetical protein
MKGDLFHPIVENAHQTAVPPYPNLSASVLRRYRIVGPFDLNVTVRVYLTAAFVKGRECRQWHRQQGRTLNLGEMLANLTASGAMNPRVGDR